MGTIRKRGNSYQARVKITKNYVQHQESKSFSSKLDALMWIETREREIQTGAEKDYDEGKTLGDAMLRYAQEITPTKKGAKNEKHRINAFMNQDYFPKDVPLMKLKTRMIAEWRDQRPIANSSKNRELSLVRSVVEMARREWNWTNHNPLTDLRSLKEPPHRNRRVSEDEINQLMEWFQFKDTQPTLQKQIVGLIFLLAIETGMRQSEITYLDWKQIKLNDKYLTLFGTKNDDNRDVPLSSRAIELLKLLSPKMNGPLFNISSDSVSQTFRKATRALGIEDLTFHDSRHEACTRLARKLGVLDLAKMIGHRDTRSLMIYYNPTATEIANRLG